MATKTTTAPISVPGAEQIKFAQAKEHSRRVLARYRDEPKVQMYLSPTYRPYLGNVMRVMINGISIYFKVDGSTQPVPQTFADEITNRRLKIDALMTKTTNLANIRQNYENTPGELGLF